MKNKIWDFLKAFGAFAVILLLLALVLFHIVDMLAPAVIPDWMYTVVGILNIPFAVAIFAAIFKEWRKQRKAKKRRTKEK